MPGPSELYVNDGLLEPGQYGFLKPTNPKTTSMEDMRQSFAENGYLFLKGLLPRQDVLEARSQYFKYISPTHVLKPGTSPVEGVFDPARDRADYPGIGAGGVGTDTEVSRKFVELALKAHKESWYKDAFCKHPVLLDFVGRFTNWGSDTLGLERTLLRNNLPGNKAIGVHYDLIFLRHGEDSVMTAWVPMGDVKCEGGGLIYLENGHQIGRQIEQEFTDRAKSCGMTDVEAKFAFNRNMMSGGVLDECPKRFGDEHQSRWLVTPYEAGDVVFHSSYMIHASTVNHDPDNVIRLGTDLRFVNTKQPWDTRWAKVYEPDDGL